MIYYMEIDPNRDTLDIVECKNIHQVSLGTKISWTDVSEYLYGTDKPVRWLLCGVPLPFIKKSGKMYLISLYKEIMDKRNYPGMSRDVMTELKFIDEFDTVTATATANKGGR